MPFIIILIKKKINFKFMKSAEYQQSSPIQPKKDSSTQCDFIIRKATKD